MIEGKTLNVFRDIVIIVGVLVICLCEMQALTFRLQARQEQALRFALARQAVARLDSAYKQMTAGKGVTEQMFRQNEVLIEYQKLLLTIAYAPLPTRAAPAAGAAAPRPNSPQTTPPQDPLQNPSQNPPQNPPQNPK